MGRSNLGGVGPAHFVFGRQIVIGEPKDCAKEFATERLTGSSVVCNTPALIADILISNGTGGVGLSKLYDGSSTAGDQKADFNTLQSTTFQYWFDPPMWMNRGIYIEVGTNVTSITVRYKSFRE